MMFGCRHGSERQAVSLPYTIRRTRHLVPADLRQVRLALTTGVVVCLAILALAAWAQDGQQESTTLDAPTPRDTFFEHSDTAKWWVSGQANFVFQEHGDFYAAYSGTNSLKDTAENATSRVLTLFTGYEFTPRSIAYLDVEE